ncbi:MAG: RsmB/NOP family class I SAM-dependent RNA methyltransferase, partial [Lachnospira sp.]|nr:RsmB/NOP family class I SAM-dependent RNA methyltransferase [Lachnospira sp.]
WIDNGFYFSEEDKPAKHPYYFAGLYYIQEPSAMTPANVLPVEEGDVVFDMCAAPGGKSTELGAKLKHTGMLITNDISNSRAKALLKNVEVFGIPNVCVISEDPKKIAGRFTTFFDKVLIDAPCSGEGMFRKDNKLIKAWEKNGPDFYAKIQRDIVLLGADMLKPGGKMLYSTCTFSRLEDEETIRHLLKERPEMHLTDIPWYDGFCHGYTDDAELASMQMDKTVRIFPHKMEGEGHFIALLEKDMDANEDYHAPRKPFNVKLADELKNFINSLDYEIDVKDITVRDDKVYVIPKEMTEDSGLRIMRGGLLLGELKKNRFEPSQALAMVLKKSEYKECIDLPVSDDRVIRYLKGETIDLPEHTDDSNGWKLFCVDGYPLGWGKLNNGSLKNKYLAGWRWA